MITEDKTPNAGTSVVGFKSAQYMPIQILFNKGLYGFLILSPACRVHAVRMIFRHKSDVSYRKMFNIERLYPMQKEQDKLCRKTAGDRGKQEGLGRIVKYRK